MAMGAAPLDAITLTTTTVAPVVAITSWKPMKSVTVTVLQNASTPTLAPSTPSAARSLPVTSSAAILISRTAPVTTGAAPLVATALTTMIAHPFVSTI